MDSNLVIALTKTADMDFGSLCLVVGLVIGFAVGAAIAKMVSRAPRIMQG